MVQNPKGSEGHAVRSNLITPDTSHPIPLLSWKNFKKANRKKEINKIIQQKKEKKLKQLSKSGHILSDIIYANASISFFCGKNTQTQWFA